MFQFFHELKCSYETDLGQDLVLFSNKDILIDRKTFFYKSWFKKGIRIFRVHDLLTESGAFFSHCEFTKRHNLNCNFLQYLQVVSAIPKRLLEKARQNLDPKFTFSQDNTFFSAVIYNKSESSEIEEQRLLLVIYKHGESRTQGT